MNVSLWSYAPDIAEIALVSLLLASIVTRRQARRYTFFCLFVGLRAVYAPILLVLLLLAGHGLEPHTVYWLYFYIYHFSFALESMLGLILIQSIFNLAMSPFDGLKHLGTLVFRWALCISFAIALATALVPHPAGETFIVGFVTELQRTQSLLTLGLLIFVCFAIRPMGLTYRSRIFGVSLGLGIQATTTLLASAWMAHSRTMFAGFNTVTSIGSCTALLLWIAYFVLPEPKRRLIVLPTTSPFLRWNQIAQVLGDHSGFVAVAGVPPELFAPAELEVMRRASAKMAGQPRPNIDQPQSA